MSTMHDVLDAQWMYDNFKDGKFFLSLFSARVAQSASARPWSPDLTSLFRLLSIQCSLKKGALSTLKNGALIGKRGVRWAHCRLPERVLSLRVKELPTINNVYLYLLPEEFCVICEWQFFHPVLFVGNISSLLLWLDFDGINVQCSSYLIIFQNHTSAAASNHLKHC